MADSAGDGVLPNSHLRRPCCKNHVICLRMFHVYVNVVCPSIALLKARHPTTVCVCACGDDVVLGSREPADPSPGDCGVEEALPPGPGPPFKSTWSRWCGHCF